MSKRRFPDERQIALPLDATPGVLPITEEPPPTYTAADTRSMRGEAAYEATEAAIQQVDDGATEFDRARVQKGLDGVLADATPNVPRFTSDDIWYWMEDHGIAPPREPRLLGAIIRKYVADGKIRDSGMFFKSTRRHCAPLRLWERIF